MGRSFEGTPVEPILDAAKHWKSTALLAGGSVFFDDEEIWTIANFQALKELVVDRPKEGKQNYLDYLEERLENVNPEVIKLATELLWLYYLIPVEVGLNQKKSRLKQIFELSGSRFPSDTPWLSDEKLSGIGSTGGSLSRIEREFPFAIDVMFRLLQVHKDKRSALLESDWQLGEWLGKIEGGNQRQFRHMFLFLLFPDTNEDVFAGGPRKQIVERFKNLPSEEVERLSARAIDKYLYEIRLQQEEKYGHELGGFFESPLREKWKDSTQERRTWLLSWNPSKWNWESLAADRLLTHEGNSVFDEWSCSNSSAVKGDRAFLVKVGQEPKGIIAIGNVDSDSFVAPHWDVEKSNDGVEQRSVKVEFTCIQDPTKGDPYITASDLSQIDVDNQQWWPQTSGIEIKEESARLLEQRWGEVVGQSRTIKEPCETLNSILYGPPGTGKTHNTSNRALAIIDGVEFSASMDDKERFKALRFDLNTGDGQIGMVTFHQNYAYEDFMEGIRPALKSRSEGISYELRDGIFKKIAGAAKAHPELRFALIIDEINRGNIAKIFGELITLIEPSRRIGKESETWVTLPYSGEPFAVPDNLYLIGTMNTADRSIQLLDTALRRRFTFIEMMPDPNHDYVSKDVAGVNCSTLLEAINKRISVLLDREHQIGHTYFFNVTNIGELSSKFQNQVFPLLQEYFFDDWAKIRAVLNNNAFITEERVNREGAAASDDYQDEEEIIYQRLPHDEVAWQSPAEYQKIYEPNSTS